MNVVLDTNIYVADFLMRSSHFELLFDYLSKTNSRILMPRIVYEELREQYRSRIDKHLLANEGTRRCLERMLVNFQVPSPIDLDVEDATEEYLRFVEAKLGLRKDEIMPLRDSHLSELVGRSISRQKPFSESGEEFRDALLWLTVLDIARETNEEMLAFISRDGRSFGRDDQLYAVLQEEASTTGTHVSFYSSIDGLIQSRAEQVDYVSQGWLFEAIGFAPYADIVTQRLQALLVHDIERISISRDWEGLEFTGYLYATHDVTEDNLTEYYIYEKSDGALFVQANIYIEYEIEFDSTESPKKSDSSTPYWAMFGEEHQDFPQALETRTIYKCVEVEVIFEVVVVEGKAVDVQLTSVYV